MARIRTIKPEFWRSPSTAKASPRARLLYIAMWNWADDYGVGEWTPRELLGFAFPNDLEVTNAEFQCLCTEVATCFDTVFYLVSGRRFYYIPAWDTHQKNERRAQGKYPLPDDPKATSDQEFPSIAEMRGASVQSSGDTASGTGEQGNRGTGSKERAIRLPADWEPTSSHRERAKQKGLDIAHEAEQFRLHAETNDRHAVKWNSAFTSWLNLAKPRGTTAGRKLTNVERNLAQFNQTYGGESNELQGNRAIAN